MSDVATVTTQEPRFRVNVKETAKGQCQCEVTARGDTAEEATEQAAEALRTIRQKLVNDGRELV